MLSTIGMLSGCPYTAQVLEKTTDEHCARSIPRRSASDPATLFSWYFCGLRTDLPT